jgi:hypothetical protein
MSNKIKVWLVVAGLLLVAAIADIVRYATPGPEQKTIVQDAGSFPVKEGTTFISVYNAYGGIFPGLADMVHKIVSPKTYPCNLCYQAFGNFGMKPVWKSFLDSLPFKKTALHIEQFKNQYQPADLPLPAILLSNENGTQLLVSAAELNQATSLEALIALVKSKLAP